jgi:hypothetical protein
MSTQENEERSTIYSTAGGVMTDEVGAVTGDLEIVTWVATERLGVSVRYPGADEWYTVTGSPVSLEAAGHYTPADLHERVVSHLSKPGPAVNGNEEPVSLEGLSLPRSGWTL